MMIIYLCLLLLSCGVDYISAGIVRQSNSYRRNNDQIEGDHIPPSDNEDIKDVALDDNLQRRSDLAEERVLKDILGKIDDVLDFEYDQKRHHNPGNDVNEVRPMEHIPPDLGDGISEKRQFMTGKKSQRNLIQRLENEIVHQQRVSDIAVESWGVDPDLLMEYSTLYKGTPRENKFRDGAATDICTCKKVTSVPSKYRDANYFYKPVPKFYQRFIECYGIPILGSNQVTDEGLKRSCYELEFLLSGRYDLRNMYYKFYGRICVIAKNENQNDLPEYSDMDDSINTRAKGLGPTVDTPITSVGDENMRCDPDGRYHDQDILIHEFGHAIQRLGAAHAMPGFNSRLHKLYTDAMALKKYHIKTANGYKPLYACENMYEYWGVCTQIYYESFRSTEYTFVGKGPGGSDLLLHDRDTLKYYDSGIVALMDEVYPCENYIINRCAWKDCSLEGSFELIYTAAQAKARANCIVIKSSYTRPDPKSCAEYTCFHQGNAFNYKSKSCEVLKCTVDSTLKVPTRSTITYDQSNGSWDIYAIKTVMDLTLQEEKSQSLEALCTEKREQVLVNPTTSKSKRCARTTSTKVCGPTPNTDSQTTCEGRGCCYDSAGCYYPIQSCSDHSVYCKDNGFELEPGTSKSKCASNPVFMLRKCPLACNMCDYSYRVWKAETKAAAMCQDQSCFHDEAKNCDSDLNAIKTRCPKKCKSCNLGSTWKSDLNIDDFSNWKEV